MGRAEGDAIQFPGGGLYCLVGVPAVYRQGEAPLGGSIELNANGERKAMISPLGLDHRHSREKPGHRALPAGASKRLPA